MCGRFYVEPEDDFFRDLAEEINRSPLLPRFEGRIPAAGGTGIYGGEVSPGSVVPVFAPDRSGRKAVFPMQWGYRLQPSGGRKPSLIINARTETAADKPLFRDSWRCRRCVIPATAYFEWEHRLKPDGRRETGRKYRISPAGDAKTWLAGLYRLEAGLPVFVVLTREPAEEIRRIHDRMPLMLPESGLEEWISPDGDPRAMLGSALTRTTQEPADAPQ